MARSRPPLPSSGMTKPAPIRVGLLGCGNVGGALAKLLISDSKRLAERTGLAFELSAIAVRSQARERDHAIPTDLFTTDSHAMVSSTEVDVVVELIGGIEPARTLILTALKAGKPVVTANKELLANCGSELYEAASQAGVALLFEAAVAGGIPIIRPLRESLAGEHVGRVMGIVNGTTNFILSRMTEGGASYHDALAEAQSLGYAERDPTADVEGFDAAAKAAIIANVAFGSRVVAGDVYREGIADITPSDIAMAQRMGYVIKLLAVIEQDAGGVATRVHPTMLPEEHPLASVRDSFNAVFVEGDEVGELMFLGRGAGGPPTASAVLGDLIDAAHDMRNKSAARVPTLRDSKVRPIDDLVTAYYLRLLVADRPGVLHAVAGVLGGHNVSIRSMEQEADEDSGENAKNGVARLVFVTHPAVERDVQACLYDLRALDVVQGIGGVIRVIGSSTPGR